MNADDDVSDPDCKDVVEEGREEAPELRDVLAGVDSCAVDDESDVAISDEVVSDSGTVADVEPPMTELVGDEDCNISVEDNREEVPELSRVPVALDILLAEDKADDRDCDSVVEDEFPATVVAGLDIGLVEVDNGDAVEEGDESCDDKDD